MASGRPVQRMGPPGGSGPRGGQRRPTVRPSVRPGQRPGGARPRPAGTALRVRPRLTGRAAVLVLVVSVLMVSYASSFRAYLEQRSQLQQLEEEITRSNAAIKELEREKERWKDPAYTEAAARKAFGWVMPGETGFTVIDENGQPLQPVDSLSDPRVSTDGGTPEWYDAAWGSVLLAGNPPEPEDEPQPVGTIKVKPEKTP